jgi:hypothetical protein
MSGNGFFATARPVPAGPWQAGKTDLKLNLREPYGPAAFRRAIAMIAMAKSSKMSKIDLQAKQTEGNEGFAH